MSGGSPADGVLSVEPTPSADGASWNEFVGEHPDATYCHRFEWRSITEAAYGRSCTYLRARRDGKLAGVLPLVWMPERIAGRRLVSVPYLDLGGPLAADSVVERALIDAALDLADSLGARSIELRECGGGDEDRQPAGRFRFILDLPDDAEVLWRSLGSKVRNQVRKARKSNLTTTRASPEKLPAFYEIFGRNMRDLGSPVHSIRFLSEVFDGFGDSAHLFLTTGKTGETVAGAVGISCGDTMSVPWASALRSARPLCPNHSLYWTILEESVAAGLSSFDFGRSSAGSGTFQFKKQWGATPLPLAWREVDRQGSHLESRAPASRLDRLMVALWKRLPLALANRLGPVVRGHLPQ